MFEPYFKKATKYIIHPLLGYYYLKYLIYYKSNPEKPWLTKEANDYLDAHLNPKMICFEWGSGRSTIYFAKRIKKVISREHNPTWFLKVTRMINHNHLKNIDYKLVLPNKTTPTHKTRDLSTETLLNTGRTIPNFSKYCASIDSFPRNHFDFIVIDGRSRMICLKKALPHLKRNGLLILDNAERNNYREAKLLLKGWQRIHTTNNVWDTDIWIKP